MTSRRYKIPANRHQQMLLPESIEAYVEEDNPVRAIDVYVDTLDLSTMQFKYTKTKKQAGQPAYDPACLLKLYLYGYINKVRSSRRLEKETHRNLEVIWLMGKLQPSYKTICNFRKNNAEALKLVNRDFIVLCKELELLGGEIVGIDGSFFSGNASKASIYTEAKLNAQLEEIERQIEEYQQQLNQQDQYDDEAGKGSLVSDGQLGKKLQQIREKQIKKKGLSKQLKASNHTQISTTDPDARLLRKRGQSTAGYNVQIGVDSKHKLIVHSSVTNDGNDTHQLSTVAIEAKALFEVDRLIAIADSGYYESEQIKRCEDCNITTYVAIPDKSKKVRAQGRYTRDAFYYDKEADIYLCPQGEKLTRVGVPRKIQNKVQLFYTSKKSICKQCTVRKDCLAENSTARQIGRWEYEEVAERHKQRMKNSGHWMRLRSALAEHPFGTLKQRAGWSHFLVRGLEKVSGELSLMIVCYNFTRLLSILGINAFKRICEQRLAYQ